MPRSRDELLTWLRSHRYVVQATVSARARPQAAVVGVAVSDSFEIVFDTLTSTRKAVNLLANPALSITFGSLAADASRTVQIDGVAAMLADTDPDRERLVSLYLSVFPDGVERQSWPGLIYVRVTPTWLRDSDYAATPPRIDEWTGDELRRLT